MRVLLFDFVLLSSTGYVLVVDSTKDLGWLLCMFLVHYGFDFTLGSIIKDSVVFIVN